MSSKQDELWATIFRENAQPLQPIPTDCSPVLRPLPGIRAVLFDVYGTLLISASGEVGISRQMARQAAFLEALQASGIEASPEAGNYVGLFFDTIEELHAEGRAQGVEYPEVDFADVWQQVLDQLAARQLIAGATPNRRVCQRLAVEFEARVNPVWPMPGVRCCLEQLASGGWLLGIVSNAQFYTRALFPALLGATAEALGIRRDLQFCSFEQGVAKPGVELYQRAADKLTSEGIDPASVLYVGNDLLNDVMPAARVGFRTALFAGDARSLRLRKGDPRVAGVAADIVLTDLKQLPQCLEYPAVRRPEDSLARAAPGDSPRGSDSAALDHSTLSGEQPDPPSNHQAEA